MRHRILLALVSLAVVAAACGEGVEYTGDGVSLRYSYQPGDTLVYNTDLQMTIDVTAEGDLGDLGVPGGLDMTMDMAVMARSGYRIDEGPDPATVRLTVSTEFLDGTITADVLGTRQEIPFDEILGESPAFDVELIIDAQGAIVEMLVGGETVPLGLLEGLGGGTDSLLSGFDPAQLLGPELPDERVGVGSTWTTETDTDVLGLRIHSGAEHTITATEVVAGRDTYRIETITTTDAVSFTLEDLMEALSSNPELIAELSGEDLSAAELEMAIGFLGSMGVEMSYHMDRSVAESTTWFDAAAGVVVRMEAAAPQRMSMEMKGIPDAGDFALEMDMTMTTTMQLAE